MFRTEMKVSPDGTNLAMQHHTKDDVLAGQPCLIPLRGNGWPLRTLLAMAFSIDMSTNFATLRTTAIRPIDFFMLRYGDDPSERHLSMDLQTGSACWPGLLQVPEGFTQLQRFVDSDGDAITTLQHMQLQTGREWCIGVDLNEHASAVVDGLLQLWVAACVNESTGELELRFQPARAVKDAVDADGNPRRWWGIGETESALYLGQMTVNMTSGNPDEMFTLMTYGEAVEQEHTDRGHATLSALFGASGVPADGAPAPASVN